MDITTKQFFLPGDSVTLRQEIKNKPEMYVVRKSTKFKTLPSLNHDQMKMFEGLVCRWFTNDGVIQEAVFNTKDLIKI